MKVSLRLTAAEIARAIQGRVEGDAAVVITGLAPIDQARPGDLTFIAQPRYFPHLDKTPAAAVLVDATCPSPRAGGPVLIRTQNPYFAFVEIAKKFLQPPAPTPGVHPTAVIDASTRLGKNVAIGPYVIIEPDCEIGDDVRIGALCFIGRGAHIGSRSVIFPQVHIAHEVQIGNEVIIQAGSVVGSDGFGYVKHEGGYHKIPHVGTVVLEDGVEIGANCGIDRGTFGETRIRRGAKLDNLIQVAHNVEIGEHTVIAAQTGISGSTKIGNRVTIAGQVGFVGHIEIADDTTFGAQCGVTKSIPPGMTVSGYPAREHMQWRREEAALRRLPELLKRVRALEKALAKIAPEVLEKNGNDDT
ncbi:MAG: UDP-3-O-(3-hydroxymyristoyl)glucosamine N-acyltransferase [candidate division KSB1 bacterium]|nr:UDP-3-O-(3-hydroxymyristoyl)glucosamine N-acyltransferase [candidate division KSB1 bacterium]MDZ7313732.1 UDP-3-O-(3-hydroxymyristoyl)glucosamine N-acyltransferase [candidate division KSB1 bacterium]